MRRLTLCSILTSITCACNVGQVGGNDPPNVPDAAVQPRDDAALVETTDATPVPDADVVMAPDAGMNAGVVPDPDAGVEVVETDPLTGFPTGSDSWTALCAKGYGDMISRTLCGGLVQPTLTSLADLRALLGLTIDPAHPQVGTSFTLLGHSTAISGRYVTPINPRAFLFTQPLQGGAPNPQYQILGFSRGEQFVELAANDPSAGDAVRLFLIRFQLSCEPNCNFADLLTPSVESGWVDWSVYDDDALKNTTLDCLQCHQPDGPGTTKLLRMQEIKNPWAHWFYEERAENLAMENDYLAAHQGESYAGIPSDLILPSRPFRLQRLLENNGFATQPNEFDTLTIRTELMANGTSPTWSAIYDQTVSGNAIPVPYYQTQTDPVKVAAAIRAYTDTMTGAMPRDQMPDIRDTVLDDALDELSYRPKAGLDGHGIMVHICQHCHNSRLDQTLSRANFNIPRLASLPRFEKDAAIWRLQLPDNDRHKMPPPRYHTLSDDERDAVIAELMR